MTQRVIVDGIIPTDDKQNNASIAIAYDGSDQPITIEKVIGGITYTKTLTWTSGNLTAISAWS
jgi:hypothetical protein